MRLDAPSPDDLRGARIWAEATFTHIGSEVTVPVAGGNMIWQADQNPGTRISSLTIPRLFEHTDLLKEKLVGSGGHRVTIRQHSDAWPGPWTLGEFQVDKAAPAGPTVTVNATDLRAAINDHEARVPYGVFPGATIEMILRELATEDRVQLFIDSTLPNIIVPVGFAVGESRGEAVTELLTAWGATMVPSPDGGLLIKRLPADEIQAQPDIRFIEGHGGTLVGAELELARSTIWNHFRVRVHDEEFVAEAVQTSGPYGTESFGWRSHPVIESDAIGGRAQAQAIALTERAQARTRAVTVPVEAVFDPRVEPYDAVDVASEDVTGWGRVTGIDTPVTGQGTAVYHVGMEVH